MSEREAPLIWHKSSFSQSGDCVEWSYSEDAILLRSSRDPSGNTLAFTRPEWLAFVAGVKSGEADLDDIQD
jgi:Domain of unknown function (DUF397)